uniref:Odorant-binding protein 2 n=1 Tax=Oedaleus infernalis TaxID=267432 RepID=A0A385I8A6_9ORTH|nr:odorant-binding protein 2 [Oedaleus infernalis]
MKGFQICTLICAVVAHCMCDKEEAIKILRASVDKCSTGYGLSRETTQYIVKHNFIIQDENDENQRCFVQCVGQELGDFNSEGIFDVDHATETAEKWLQWNGRNKSNLREAMEECAKITGTGTCMTTYLITKCAMKAGE